MKKAKWGNGGGRAIIGAGGCGASLRKWHLNRDLKEVRAGVPEVRRKR